VVATLLLVVATLLPAASGSVQATGPDGDVLWHIPVRWCVLRGAPLAGERVQRRDRTLLQRHRRASDQIWQAARVTFRSAAIWRVQKYSHYPVIDDPSTRRGRPGDVVLPEEDDHHEYFRVEHACRVAWDRLRRGKTPIHGPIVVSVNRFVHRNGRRSSIYGWGGFTDVTTRRGKSRAAICRRTRVIKAGGGSLLIVDPSVARDRHEDARLLAHELGHVLKLGHGNGLDDNRNGFFDSNCDDREYQYALPNSLMNHFLPDATRRLSRLQRRLVGRLVPNMAGALKDPPMRLVNGNTFSDERPDEIDDVDDPSIDVSYVAFTVNPKARAMVYTFSLLGPIPSADSGEVVNEYVVFTDLEPGSGGSPDEIGFPSQLPGVDLIAKVAVDGAGGALATVWKWQGSTFEECCSDGIAAFVEPMIPEDSQHFQRAEQELEPAFNVVDLVVDFDVAQPQVAPSEVRIQAMAESLLTGESDVQPGGRGAILGDEGLDMFLALPEYPVCQATPGSVLAGSTVDVRGAGFGLGGRTVEIVLGTRTLGTTQVREGGNVNTSVVIPRDAATGLRAVSVGVVDTALTADCALEVTRRLPIQGIVPAPKPPPVRAVTLEPSVSQSSFDDPTDTLDFGFRVTNSGNVPLGGPVVVTSDASSSDSISSAVLGDTRDSTPVDCPGVRTVGNGDRALDPGESVRCAWSYDITQADLDAGSVTAISSVSVDGVTSRSELTVAGIPEPGLTLDKSTTTESYDEIGDSIDYTFVVTNTGNLTLTGPFEVTDPRIAGGPVCEELPETLAPDAFFTCTATYPITQADLDARSVTNVATATGGGETSTDSVRVRALYQEVTLVKSADVDSYDSIDDVIEYRYLVTNTGTLPISDFHIHDDKAASGSFGCSEAPEVLNPDASVTCTFPYNISQQDLDNHQVTNSAYVHYEDEFESNTATLTIYAVVHVGLDFSKTAQTSHYESVGDELYYRFEFENTGNVTLNLELVDEKIDSLECPSSIAPGESLECLGTHTVTDGDLSAGDSIVNTATAYGRSGDYEVSVADTATIDEGPAIVQLTLDKTANRTWFDHTVASLEYTYVLRNTGNVVIQGPFWIVDDKFTSDITCDDLPPNLAPDESAACTAEYTITAADRDAGGVTNTATAHAIDGVDSNADTVTVPQDLGPEIGGLPGSRPRQPDQPSPPPVPPTSPTPTALPGVPSETPAPEPAPVEPQPAPDPTPVEPQPAPVPTPTDEPPSDPVPAPPTSRPVPPPDPAPTPGSTPHPQPPAAMTPIPEPTPGVEPAEPPDPAPTPPPAAQQPEPASTPGPDRPAKPAPVPGPTPRPEPPRLPPAPEPTPASDTPPPVSAPAPSPIPTSANAEPEGHG
jgi:hypothetical protein